MARNVLGGELESCSTDPLTGFYRDGCCNTGGGDVGVHVVCARVTEEFLVFSASVGNDLSTPNPAFGFRGLVPGDRWCLCADRWVEAKEAGVAPPLVLDATHAAMLEYATLDELRAFAHDDADRDPVDEDPVDGGPADEDPVDENTVDENTVDEDDAT